MVLAPYSAVLMPDARESLGIELQDSVLVFDEAHNLLDAINSAHSTAVTGEVRRAQQECQHSTAICCCCWSVTTLTVNASRCTSCMLLSRGCGAHCRRCPDWAALPHPAYLVCAAAAWQLLSVQRSLTAYYDRFKAVLNPLNAQNIQRLLHIAAALHTYLQPRQAAPSDEQQQQQPGAGSTHTTAAGAAAGSSSSGSRLSTVNDMLFDLGLDNINMFELAHWVRDNKMAFKVS